MVRKILPAALIKAAEKIYRLNRGLFWQLVYGFPGRGLRVIAVTGTNGKTSTASYINEVLKAGGYKTALMTTAFVEIAGKYEPSRSTYTLQKQSEAQRFLRRAKNTDADFVILEVTSHALHQDRIMGIPVEIGVLTNLTQEHLDYHKTMANYAAAKALLFQKYGAKHAVLNADSDWFGFFRDTARCEVFSYGRTKASNLRIANIKLTSNGSSAEATYSRQKINIKPKLLGEFNIYNAAAAAAVGLLLHIEPAKIEVGVAKLTQISGRMEEINEGQDFRVLVDFAVTPDAIERVLQSLQKVAKGKVRIVFGATGDRDKTKRPAMGEAAADYADFIYLTDDETYTEDAAAIRTDVLKGIQKAGGSKKTKEIGDRGEAIKAALTDAKKGDIVLITGMGHEDSRNLGGKAVPWQDQQVARKFLRKLS